MEFSNKKGLSTRSENYWRLFSLLRRAFTTVNRRLENPRQLRDFDSRAYWLDVLRIWCSEEKGKNARSNLTRLIGTGSCVIKYNSMAADESSRSKLYVRGLRKRWLTWGWKKSLLFLRINERAKRTLMKKAVGIFLDRSRSIKALARKFKLAK